MADIQRWDVYADGYMDHYHNGNFYKCADVDAALSALSQENKDLRERLAGAEKEIELMNRIADAAATNINQLRGAMGDLARWRNRRAALQQLADEGQARGEYK